MIITLQDKQHVKIETDFDLFGMLKAIDCIVMSLLLFM